MLPVIAAIREQSPKTQITWVIGKVEHRLVGHLPGVEFVVFDKSQGISEYFKIKRLFKGRVFDALLLMQVAMRANLLAPMIRAKRKIGYDAARAKDLHSVFVSEPISPLPSQGQHVADSFFSFIERLGFAPVAPERRKWVLPAVAGAEDLAQAELDKSRPTLLISPCSSHSLRNWTCEGYASVADYAAAQHNMQVLLCGGRSELEQNTAADIEKLCKVAKPVNLVGKDTFAQFIELLRGSDVLLSPDSGPVHMAAITDTPAIGLHACSNSKRSGPYKSLRHCVDVYDQAARKCFGKGAEQLKWGTKIEQPGVMALITVDQVIEKLDTLMAEQKERAEHV